VETGAPREKPQQATLRVD